MALQFISKESEPNYIALSTDIVDSKIDGASLVGATVFISDTGAWYIIESDLTLSNYSLPVNVGDITIGSVNQGNASLTERWLVDTGNSSVISTNNSTSTPLSGGASFTGTFEDVLEYSNVTVMVSADADSAVLGLEVGWSTDGVNHDDTDTFTIYANKPKQFTFGVTSRYLHIEYENGASDQTFFRLQVILHKGSPKPSSHRVDDTIVADDDAQLVKALLTAKSPDGTFRNISSTTNGVLTVGINDIQADAGFRVRTSQLFTLGDYKVIGYDRSEMWDNGGTGSGAWSGNTYQMSVTSGQYRYRNTRKFHPYFSGKSQMVEETFIGFAPQENVTKRVGYFSSNATAPYNSNLDGFWLESSGGSIALKSSRNGTETLNKDITEWSGYSNLQEYSTLSTWDNFTVVIFDYLWLGGAIFRLWIKTSNGFCLAHQFNFSGTSPNVFILSPNQPLRYDIYSSTGTGSFTYVCSQCATEGSVNESGSSRFIDTSSAISLSSAGTTYPILSVRKQSAYREVASLVEFIDALLTSANDYARWSLQVNPTLSAPLTYNPLANSPLEYAVGNGTITVSSSGIRVAGGSLRTGVTIASTQLQLNYLSWLGGTIDNTMDNLTLCVTPLSGSLSVWGGLGAKIY